MTNTVERLEVGTKIKFKPSAFPGLVALTLGMTDFYDEEFEVHQIIEEGFKFTNSHVDEDGSESKRLLDVVKEEGDEGLVVTVLVPDTSDFMEVSKEEAYVDGFVEIVAHVEDLEVIQ